MHVHVFGARCTAMLSGELQGSARRSRSGDKARVRAALVVAESGALTAACRMRRLRTPLRGAAVPADSLAGSGLGTPRTWPLDADSGHAGAVAAIRESLRGTGARLDCRS